MYLVRKLKLTCLSVALSLIVLSLGACFPASLSTDTISVTRIVDGDTIVISSGDKVRYIGIDTPELSPPEAFAEEATRINRELVLGKTVRLEKDVSETDRYGRLLRYVWVDDTMVNLEMVKKGLAEAKAYPPDTKYQVLFEAAELEAKMAGRGMWAQK
jgi:micrococcal nuclease